MLPSACILAAGLLSGDARAEDFILEMDAPVHTGIQGRHGRPFMGSDGRWYLGHGRSGSFHVAPLDDDLQGILEEARVLVEGDGRFVDHALAACPDGSLLHVASGNVDDFDDSAWATAISSDLVAGPTITLVDRDSTMSTNDMPAICADGVVGAAFAGEGDMDLEVPNRGWFYSLSDAALSGDADLQVLPMHEAARLNGTSLVWNDRSQQLAVVAMTENSNLDMTFYDSQLAYVSSLRRQVGLADGVRAYWSAGTVPAASGYAIVHLGRHPDAGFIQDQGDVVLTVAGPDLWSMESQQVTALEPPDGAMRPAIAIHGDELLLAWDVDGEFYVARARLNLEAIDALAGDAPQDTGLLNSRDDSEDQQSDTAAPVEESPSSPNNPRTSQDAGCGCGALPGRSALPALGLLALAGSLLRRRS